MRVTINQQEPDEKPESLKSKWLWFIGLYLAGLLVTAGVAYFFRFWLNHA